jgi:LysM repeat protein
MFGLARLASGRVRTKKWLAIAPIVLVACGSGRNYDNPPEVAPISADFSTTTAATTIPTTTVFVPSTAPTTLGAPTVPPTPPPPPPPPPTAPPTPRPTEATVPTTPVPTSGETYTVAPGDTLFGISRRLGVTLVGLLGANGLNESSLIQPGQTLQIPEGGAVPATNPPATDAPAPGPTEGAPAPTSPQVPLPPAGRPATTTFAPPAGAVQPTGASATCQDRDSNEADGTRIVFAPSNVLDHNPATAWRCPMPATGQTLTMSLSGATHLTSVGMIGGYVKVDPLTEVDRFPQNHRVRQVKWTFSDGTFVTQDLADSRDMQTMAVDVTTTTVTIEILATYPPSGEDQKDTVVVAEVQLLGG